VPSDCHADAPERVLVAVPASSTIIDRLRIVDGLSDNHRLSVDYLRLGVVNLRLLDVSIPTASVGPNLTKLEGQYKATDHLEISFLDPG